jgi:hypothetical protein
MLIRELNCHTLYGTYETEFIDVRFPKHQNFTLRFSDTMRWHNKRGQDQACEIYTLNFFGSKPKSWNNAITIPISIREELVQYAVAVFQPVVSPVETTGWQIGRVDPLGGSVGYYF